jgi:hypothetical protein
MGTVANGNSTVGYGQSIVSSALSNPPGKITALQWNYLQQDIDRAYTHINGNSAGLTIASNGAGYAITGISSNATTITVNTTAYPTTWPTGMVVAIVGSSNSGYNSPNNVPNWGIVGVSPTQFTISSNTNPGAAIGVNYTITSITSTPTTITVNTSAFPCVWPTGMTVVISGMSPSAYNGTWTITGVSKSQFTIASTANPGASTSIGTVLAQPVVIVPAVKIRDSDRVAYATAATFCSTNSLSVPPLAQTALTQLANGQRATPWNTSVTHTVTMTFSTRAAAQYFFNAGSQLQLSASLTGYPTGVLADTSTAKNDDWALMLTNLGIVKLGANSTTGTGSYTSIASNVGFYQLTTTPALIVQKTTASPTYSPNQYDVYASVDGTGRILTFSIQFQDLSVGHGVADENITGTLNSYVKAYYDNNLVNVGTYLPSVASSGP